MTDKELMEQALKALVSSTGELHLHLASPTDMQLVKNQKAIAALRERLAQSEQEPVAWISTGPARMINWTSDKPAYGDDWVPLYTTPPQRPWVGLTDEEVGQLATTPLFQNVWPHSTFAAIHAIEDKLKEKNT